MRVFQNFLYNILYEILVMLIPLITMPYISRVLGAEGYGIYAYTYAVVCYFALFILLGIQNYGTRSIATCFDNIEKRSKLFHGIYRIQFTASILVILVYLLYVFFLVDDHREIALLQVIYLISVGLDINWFYFGLEQFRLTVIRNVIVKLSTTAAIFLLIRTRQDLPLYVIILTGGTLLSQLILWGSLPRFLVSVRVPLRSSLSHLSPVMLLFLPAVATSIYRCMDKVMLGILRNETQVGYYTQAENLEWTCLSVITALGTVMVPTASKLTNQGDQKQLSYYTGLSFQSLTVLTVAISFGLMGMAPAFIPFFLGKEFIPVVGLIMLLSPSMFFIAWENIIRTQYLIPRKRDKAFTLSVFSGALINLIANLLLIPSLGAYGTVIGTLLAECSVFIIQSFMARHVIPVWKNLRSCLYYFIPGLIMFSAVLFIGTLPLPIVPKLLLQFISGVTVFTAFSLPYMILKKTLLWSAVCRVFQR